MLTNRDMSCRIAVIAVAGMIGLADRSVQARCMHDRASQHWAAASISCPAELARTGDPARAVDAAMAAYYQERWPETVQLATGALGSRWAADAHYLIGAAQLQLDQLASAASHLVVAVTLHGLAGEARAEARDLYLLSGVWFQLGDYGPALRAEEASREAARLAHDDRMMIYADIARADIFRAIGDFRLAEIAIEDALAAAREPKERVSALLKRGMLHIEQGMPELAREPFVQALQEERASRQPRREILEALHLNLSYVDRKARDFTGALDQLEQAKQAGAGVMQYRLNRGLVFADMGRLNAATADLAAAEAEQPEGEWGWWVPLQRARVAARLGELGSAIAADQRAIGQVAVLATGLGALGPTLVANHREPHLHLIGLYASVGRWNDALEVIATMDAQSLLASSEHASDPAPSTSRAALPKLRRPASVVASDAAARTVRAWRGEQLVIVVPGGDRIWRLDVHDGSVTGRDVGAAGELATVARTLERDPGNVDAGRALGAAMLGPDLVADTRVALLVIGPLARAPLAGLRLGDAPASTRYQLVRARGVLPRLSSAHATLPPVVIGDPGDDLPAAKHETQRVAERLQVNALVGGAATRAAFARAAGARLVHIAAHTVQDRDGTALRVADGAITATEVAKLTPAPGLVVLASCGAAAGRDDAGNGSLAAAFLDAGADTVVATRWSVADAEAAQLIDSFYAHGGADDPARALGAAQRSSKLAPMTWAAFEVFAARPTP